MTNGCEKYRESKRRRSHKKQIRHKEEGVLRGRKEKWLRKANNRERISRFCDRVGGGFQSGEGGSKGRGSGGTTLRGRGRRANLRRGGKGGKDQVLTTMLLSKEVSFMKNL